MPSKSLLKSFFKSKKKRKGKAALTEDSQDKLSKALAMIKKTRKKKKLGSKTVQRTKFRKKLGSSIAKNR